MPPGLYSPAENAVSEAPFAPLTAPVPVYKAEIEFVSGSYTNITSDCLRFSITRQLANLLLPLQADRAMLEIDNEAGTYSPKNNANLSPYKRLRISATYISSEYRLFSGTISDIVLDPVRSQNSTILEAVSDVERIRNIFLTSSLYINTNPATLFTVVMSECSVNSFAADAFTEQIPYAWYRNYGADKAITDLIESGKYSFYVDGAGTVQLKNRFFGEGGVELSSYLLLPGTSGDYASTPDSATVSITGDIDLRVQVKMDDWTPAAAQVFLSKRIVTGNQRSYRFACNPSGTLEFWWSALGSNDNVATSTAATGFTNGEAHWVRVTLDVDNGAAGNDVKFYTSDTKDGTVWTQLGSTVTTAGTTSIFDSTSAVELGSGLTGTATLLAGKVYQAQIYNGIGGTLAADFDATSLLGGTTSITGSTGEVWTVNGAASIVGPDIEQRYDEFFGLTYSLNRNAIINQARIQSQPREPSTSVGTVAWLGQQVTIPASSGQGFWLAYVDPVEPTVFTPITSFVTPVASTDYYANTSSDGTGTDRTATTSLSMKSFGGAAVCSLFNGSADTVQLTRFQIRGYSLKLQPAVGIIADIGSSQTLYGIRGKEISNSLLYNQPWLRDYAAFIALEHKDPLDEITYTLKNQFPDQITTELGQGVSLINSVTGINSNWTIRSINHEVTLVAGLEHTTTYGVVKRQTRDWLILDDPVKGALDSGRKLAL